MTRDEVEEDQDSQQEKKTCFSSQVTMARLVDKKGSSGWAISQVDYVILLYNIPSIL